MTAHNKKNSYRQGLLKIAQSAYHIGGHNKNTMSATAGNNWGQSAQFIYHQNQQSIQVADGVMTLGAGSTLPVPLNAAMGFSRIQSANPVAGGKRMRGPNINSIDMKGPKVLGQGLYGSSTQNFIKEQNV